MFTEPLNSFTEYDIKVINAYKNYGQNRIISGLNMNVVSGSIYGLLGPSGCGKSTLLQCILGIIQLDYGNIDLRVKNQKEVGYMPQDLCLNDKLTIKETFKYYGLLYNMHEKNMKNKIDELKDILELPNLNSYIDKMSGGQCRRVSLAISLLHDPKIIIVDEPTVGIDSVLRQKIWTEFRKLTEQLNKTILITTHYIEEANQANCIGFMRNGSVIEEGSPQDILAKYESDSLELAFVRLCYKQEEENTIYVDVPVKDMIKSAKPKKPDEMLNYNRTKAMLLKYLRSFSRDYVFLFTIFIFPILKAVFLCTCIGTDFNDLGIAFKNDEINSLDCYKSNIDGCITDEGSNQTISCVILNRLTSLNYMLDEVEGYNIVDGSFIKNPKYAAFIYFPKNYTSKLANFIDQRKDYDFNSQVSIQVTKHNILFKNKIKTDIMMTFNNLVKEILNGCFYNPRTLDVPLEIITITGKEVKSFMNSAISNFIAWAVLYFPLVFSVSTMLTEKMDGILGRSMIAGVTIMELVVPLFCISNGLCIVQMILPLLIVFEWFENPIQITDGLIAYAVLMIMVGWLGFFYGLIIAILSPDKLTGNSAALVFTFGQAFLSGAAWPVEGQPKMLRIVTELLPLRIAGNTMTNIALKGWTLDHLSVIKNIAILFFHCVISVIVLMCLTKKNKTIWVKYK